MQSYLEIELHNCAVTFTLWPRGNLKGIWAWETVLDRLCPCVHLRSPEAGTTESTTDSCYVYLAFFPQKCQGCIHYTTLQNFNHCAVTEQFCCRTAVPKKYTKCSRVCLTDGRNRGMEQTWPKIKYLDSGAPVGRRKWQQICWKMTREGYPLTNGCLHS